MTREEHERLYALVQNPPPGSKMEAAKVYGVDLTLNLRSLTRTPAERVREMEAALKFAEELRRAAAHLVALDAISMPLFGGEYRVASLDSLIRSKRAAGRNKDLNVLPELEALKEMHAPKEQTEPPQD